MTTEEIRAACAELMGWTIDSNPGFCAGRRWILGEHGALMALDDFNPCTDRNHSRMVVQKALDTVELLTLDTTFDIPFKWIFATPAQECEAALRATGRWK